MRLLSYILIGVLVGGLASGLGCKKEEESPASTLGGVLEDAAGEVEKASEAAVAQAEKDLDAVTKAIKDGSHDAAETTLESLEGIKSTLPESLQQKIDDARKALNDAKQ
ncbi:MAG: hypothetical protein JXA69_18670 [Phycisphaerae bacterium]|nr:hypothetical protein [Phycisphaerae bacterium]